MNRIWMLFLIACAVTVPHHASRRLAAAENTSGTQQHIDFVRDVQPLLRQRCYSCHGMEKSEGGLRLDLKQRAMEGGDSGAMIVPGQISKSRLLGIVSGTDEEIERMPPEGEGTALNADDIALLKRWIDQGAVWPTDADAGSLASKHWSFQPIERPNLPAVANRSWPRNAIDHFVLARLEELGIKPSATAGRATLLRRVYLDVLGLPPTIEQATTFLDDNSDLAYQTLIDETLKSKHYGERWGRHWLDLARYADSDGYEKDRPRPFAWRYRDWVIQALNSDLPFDQFTVQQIAGDMMANATVEQRVATGFHRNTLHNTEGGTDKEEDRVKKTIDRINTVGTTWLGLTVGCAQCHSHKYDPLTQREYFSLYAFFNYMSETDIAAPSSSEQQTLATAQAKFQQKQEELKRKIADYEQRALGQAQIAWEKSATHGAVWLPLNELSVSSSRGATLKSLPDGSVLVSGKNVTSDIYTVAGSPNVDHVTFLRLEVLPDKSLVKQGPGRADNGNFVLTNVEVTAIDEGDASTPAKLVDAQADFSQKDWQVEKAINANPDDGWAISPQIGKRHVAVFQLAEPLAIEPSSQLQIKLHQRYERGTPHNIGRFRLTVTNSATAELEGLPKEVSDALATTLEQRSSQQKDLLAKYYRGIDPTLKQLNAELASHGKQVPTSKTKAQTVSQQSLSIRQTRVFPRGDFLQKKDGIEVQAGIPAVLPQMKPRGEATDRLDFANWMVDKQNPLTARVTVNRIWQRYFGQGIVRSVDDFGTQGEAPTHPRLLDWLASELIESGWSLKHIHRLILNSATYRQASAVRDELIDVDPENELLARQTRHRVEAEIVRDLALTASGLLDRTVGGPSVRPPQPAEYSKLTYANSAKWQTSTGGDRYRRGMYTFFQRTSPYPMLMTFDAPDSTLCTASRSRSNTPMQALTIWNDPVFVECAQMLGRRIVNEVPSQKTEGETQRARIVHAFKLCLNREPTADEIEIVLELFDDQQKLSLLNEAASKQFVGQQPIADGVSAADLAGWVAVGRALLNLDEFITRE